jgi:hypothetical protein
VTHDAAPLGKGNQSQASYMPIVTPFCHDGSIDPSRAAWDCVRARDGRTSRPFREPGPPPLQVRPQLWLVQRTRPEQSSQLQLRLPLVSETGPCACTQRCPRPEPSMSPSIARTLGSAAIIRRPSSTTSARTTRFRGASAAYRDARIDAPTST